jgi:hypothetical protein
LEKGEDDFPIDSDLLGCFGYCGVRFDLAFEHWLRLDVCSTQMSPKLIVVFFLRLNPIVDISSARCDIILHQSNLPLSGKAAFTALYTLHSPL